MEEHKELRVSAFTLILKKLRYFAKALSSVIRYEDYAGLRSLYGNLELYL